ncbi:MAG: hypothetical protein CVU54_05600 [Deltaproteobacteria bacterium HGW-Deltaproteobacteria-12]|nr:MAG: hypothetical protein CVU54_05600 [Deltaproteobacteria bacterium HGW-Deltaproteobacteria-12]
MMENYRDIKKEAIDFFAAQPLTDEMESMIAMFLLNIKTSNLMIISRLETSLIDLRIFKHLQNQFYRDLEYSQLLARTTRWTLNPLVYSNLMFLGTKLWNESEIYECINYFKEPVIRFFKYLAFNHALAADIRFIPLFPATTKLDTPFLQTLYEIELNNNRSIQTQIVFLKNIEVPELSIEKKQQIVNDEVDKINKFFYDFLSQLIKKYSK